jgi:hypothetical protein
MTTQEQQRALARALSGEAAHHAGVAVAGPRGQPRNTAPSAGPHHRHGDRGSGDDDAGDATTRLPIFVRFADLRKAGIATSWQTLKTLIRDEGFPAGCLLSRNTRAWKLSDIEMWLAARPVEPKAVPYAWTPERRERERERKAKAAKAQADIPALTE